MYIFEYLSVKLSVSLRSVPVGESVPFKVFELTKLMNAFKLYS